MVVIVLPPHQASSSPLSCPQLHRSPPPPHFPSSLVKHFSQNHLQEFKKNPNPNTINDDDCAPCLSSSKTSSPCKSPLIIAGAPCNSFKHFGNFLSFTQMLSGSPNPHQNNPHHHQDDHHHDALTRPWEPFLLLTASLFPAASDARARRSWTKHCFLGQFLNVLVLILMITDNDLKGSKNISQHNKL